MQSQCGPQGLQLNAELATMAKLNAPFSQWAWEVAKQDGCLPCASQGFPTWPPKTDSAFTYPTLQTIEEVAGLDTANYGTPYAPSPQEINGAKPEGLACAVPVSMRGALTAPANQVPMLRETFYIPDDAVAGLRPNTISLAAPEATPATMHDDGTGIAPRALPALVLNTLQGIAYDMQHWGQLPAEGLLGKLSYVTTRDDRGKYLFLLGLFLLAAYVVINMLF